VYNLSDETLKTGTFYSCPWDAKVRASSDRPQSKDFPILPQKKRNGHTETDHIFDVVLV
jgi:hypothetical protein